MLSSLGSLAAATGMSTRAGFDLEAVFVYGLVAFVIGLIAWSKYREPPLSDPYAYRNTGRDLPVTESHADLRPVVAVPVVGSAAPPREQP
jgi:hypothetical protein